jgi:hypothetical protein
MPDRLLTQRSPRRGRPGDWLQFRLQSYAFARDRPSVDHVLTGHTGGGRHRVNNCRQTSKECGSAQYDERGAARGDRAGWAGHSQAIDRGPQRSTKERHNRANEQVSARSAP